MKLNTDSPGITATDGIDHPDAPHSVPDAHPAPGNTPDVRPHQTPLLDSLSKRTSSTPYRPELNKITGSVHASIFLEQLVWRWRKAGRQTFSKFISPCSHPDYRPGSSWHEELGFSRREFEGAVRAIGTKITAGVSKREARQKNILIYWTDKSRRTHWELNPVLLEARLRAITEDSDALACTLPMKCPDRTLPKKSTNTALLKNAPTPATDSANSRGSANGRQTQTPNPDALALEATEVHSRSSSSALAASESLAKERNPGAKRMRTVDNPKSSEKPEVQEPAPKDACKGLRSDIVSALGDLALREDQLDGELLGRPRTPEDVAVRIGYLLSEPGVGDRKVLRSIRKVLGMQGVKKSAIGLAIADATRNMEAREAAEAVGAVRQRTARGGSYGKRTAFVADGAPRNPNPPPDKDSYTHNGVLIEDGIRMYENQRQLDVRISDEGIYYTLEPGQRSDDEFGHDRQAVKERIKLHRGLEGLAKERSKRAAAARRTAEIEALNAARQGRETSA